MKNAFQIRAFKACPVSSNAESHVFYSIMESRVNVMDSKCLGCFNKKL